MSPHVFIETEKGTIEIELDVLDAPITAGNFITLARKGYFDGLSFHRVVPNFVIQGGDPRGDGEGGPGYTIRDELNQEPYLRGTVGMALAWRDTGGSQFFITHSPQPHLDARYTVFGRVVSGMEVVDAINQWDVITRSAGVGWSAVRVEKEHRRRPARDRLLERDLALLAALFLSAFFRHLKLPPLMSKVARTVRRVYRGASAAWHISSRA